MATVTYIANNFKQPKGGFIKPSQFEKTILDDDKVLNENENLHASIVGLSVDYLTRFMMGTSIKKAFYISILGYKNKIKYLGKEALEKDKEKKLNIKSLLEQIKGLDDESIISACRAVTYDVWFRQSNAIANNCKTSTEETIPDSETIENIRIMVNRSICFFDKYGKVEHDGFYFIDFDEKGNVIKNGYSKIVNAGDGDYLTKDTMWDFKVSKSEITNKHTLQLLMYWIMGKHSEIDMFKNIVKIGFFNPRLNKVYLLDMKDVSEDIIKQVENEVICY